MKQLNRMLVLLVLLPLLLTSQKVIENPERPAAKNAGRVVKLTEVWRVGDEGGGFYFKYPGRLRVGPDGMIYLTCDKQLLRFSPEGKFEKNLLKIGEGPGELNSLTDYRIEKERILLLSMNPMKIIFFTSEGVLKEEIRIPWIAGPQFFQISGDQILLLSTGVQFTKVKNGKNLEKHKIVSLNTDGTSKETGLEFSYSFQANVLRGEDGVGVMMEIDFPVLFTDMGEQMSMVSASAEYLIQRIDMEKKKSMAIFRRPFRRIPYVKKPQSEGEGVFVGGKKVKAEFTAPEFFPDIQRLLTVGGRLWVFTARIEAGKGVLIDVFDPDGKYVDCFLLPLKGVRSAHDLTAKLVAVQGEFLYTIEKDEEDIATLVKYKMN